MNHVSMVFVFVFMAVVFTTPVLDKQPKIYVYQLNSSESAQLVEKKISVSEGISEEEKAQTLFETLFSYSSNEQERNFIPEGTRLIGLQFHEGHLTINVSEDIRRYGGTETEQYIVAQILCTGFSIKEVQSITVLIEGLNEYLPEGTIIWDYSKQQWMEERMKK